MTGFFEIISNYKTSTLTTDEWSCVTDGETEGEAKQSAIDFFQMVVDDWPEDCSGIHEFPCRIVQFNEDGDEVSCKDWLCEVERLPTFDPHREWGTYW